MAPSSTGCGLRAVRLPSFLQTRKATGSDRPPAPDLAGASIVFTLEPKNLVDVEWEHVVVDGNREALLVIPIYSSLPFSDDSSGDDEKPIAKEIEKKPTAKGPTKYNLIARKYKEDKKTSSQDQPERKPAEVPSQPIVGAVTASPVQHISAAPVAAPVQPVYVPVYAPMLANTGFPQPAVPVAPQIPVTSGMFSGAAPPRRPPARSTPAPLNLSLAARVGGPAPSTSSAPADNQKFGMGGTREQIPRRPRSQRDHHVRWAEDYERPHEDGRGSARGYRSDDERRLDRERHRSGYPRRAMPPRNRELRNEVEEAESEPEYWEPKDDQPLPSPTETESSVNSTGSSSSYVQFEHRCCACGKLRSQYYQEERNVPRGTHPLPSLCSPCRGKLKSDCNVLRASNGDVIRRADDADIRAKYWCSICGFRRSKRYHEKHGLPSETYRGQNVCRLCHREDKREGKRREEDRQGADDRWGVDTTPRAVRQGIYIPVDHADSVRTFSSSGNWIPELQNPHKESPPQPAARQQPPISSQPAAPRPLFAEPSIPGLISAREKIPTRSQEPSSRSQPFVARQEPTHQQGRDTHRQEEPSRHQHPTVREASPVRPRQPSAHKPPIRRTPSIHQQPPVRAPAGAQTYQAPTAKTASDESMEAQPQSTSSTEVTCRISDRDVTPEQSHHRAGLGDNGPTYIFDSDFATAPSDRAERASTARTESDSSLSLSQHRPDSFASRSARATAASTKLSSVEPEGAAQQQHPVSRDQDKSNGKSSSGPANGSKNNGSTKAPKTTNGGFLNNPDACWDSLEIDDVLRENFEMDPREREARRARLMSMRDDRFPDDIHTGSFHASTTLVDGLAIASPPPPATQIWELASDEGGMDDDEPTFGIPIIEWN